VSHQTGSGSPITDARHAFAIGVVGGSATVIDHGHTRLVSDPVYVSGDNASIVPVAALARALGAVDARRAARPRVPRGLNAKSTRHDEAELVLVAAPEGER
jgi:hypothetical protein